MIIHLVYIVKCYQCIYFLIALASSDQISQGQCELKVD